MANTKPGLRYEPETLPDIVREMRDAAKKYKFVPSFALTYYGRRIEDAGKRMDERRDAMLKALQDENAELNRTIDDNLRVAKACRDSDQDEKFELRQERSRLICENAKLREALKPILEVNSDFRIYKAILCHETDKLFFLQEAVQKAKDIMNKKEE